MAVGLVTCLTGAATAQAGGGEVAAQASVQCGDTITQSIRLTRDLECPGTPEPALRIAGEGVVLDLGGHTVRRTGSDTWASEGIAVMAGSTVKNGTIRGFGKGYVLYGGRNVWLSRLQFVNNGVGAHNYGFSTFTVTDSLFIGNTVGMGSEQDASNGGFEVRSTLFIDNQVALGVNNAHTVNVDRSTFAFNDVAVVCFYGTISFTSSWILQNSAVASIPFFEGGYSQCAHASFLDTVIARNASFAPADEPVWKPFDFVLRRSQVRDNDSGIVVRTTTADVRSNTWQSNGGGLTLDEPLQFLQPTLTGTVSDNRFLRNGGDGFRVTVASTLTVSRNVAVGNTGWGIHAPGVIDGGGNVARGNGAGNCVGVVCTSP